jgi:hypothetical protein
MEQIADSSEISVVGITEVLKILGRAKEIFRLLLAEVDREPPDLAILVDFPDFNLRLARQLHQRGIPVVYYISPQVWAWRKGRVRLIAFSESWFSSPLRPNGTASGASRRCTSATHWSTRCPSFRRFGTPN